jgi:ABC-type multidrug transport system ATPase subunit
MSFRDVSSTLVDGAANPNASTFKKTILNEVSGEAVPGEILAVMGPSGSGKTSLMNVLSGRASYQEGTLSVNGNVYSKNEMKRLMAKVAYVKQADIFFGHLTVRDQFTYTALLRMKKKVNADGSTVDPHAEVERLLRLLRLSKVADSPIMMLSGGEKKRVNIGTELLTDPLLILLDEPTSGLDSTSAVSLLRLLQTLAREHSKTILTSIHQPSSAMFREFDKLLMLSEGHVVYFGCPTASLDYLVQRNVPCPAGYNAADHWMDLLVTDSAVEEERKEVQQQSSSAEGDEKVAPSPSSPRLLLQQAWDNEAVAEQMDAALKKGNNDDASSVHSKSNDTKGNSGESGKTMSKYATSWWTQYTVLTHRALKNSRAAFFTPMNLIKSFALGLVTGLLWFQTPYTEASVFNIRSYFFFNMSFWVLDSMFNALMSFPGERIVILKERASGSYRLSAYFLAKTTADAPVRLILPLLYMIVSFWLAGFGADFVVFLGVTFCTLLSVGAGEAMGLFVGAAVYDLEKGMTIMTVLTLGLMLLGGFLVENIPPFIAWAKYLSPFKYAFDSSTAIMFNRDLPCDGSDVLDSICGESGYISTEELKALTGIQGTLGFNIGMLLVFTFLPRYFAYVALRSKRAGERE